jgi:hypothetical protein
MQLTPIGGLTSGLRIKVMPHTVFIEPEKDE